MRQSFYWRGASGDFAWLFNYVLLRKSRMKRLLDQLLAAETLEDQERLYYQAEPYIFPRGFTWLLCQPAAMAFIGVPSAQLRLVENQYPGGLVAYIRDSLRRVFTSVPIPGQLFLAGLSHRFLHADCCPGYLHPDNFQTLRDRIHRVQVHSTTVTRFLQENRGYYSHFVLLDHQDWLAWHDLHALAEEWEEIFRNGRPGTRVLMRSAGPDLSFLPTAVTSRLRFFPQLSQHFHPQDRVGTYGSLHLAEVL